MPALLSGSANILILTVDKCNECNISHWFDLRSRLCLILIFYTKACIIEYINPEEILWID